MLVSYFKEPNFQLNTSMKVNEVITELSFHGRKCTKDCSGHAAGYKWALARNQTVPCTSHNPSFNSGCDIAISQIKNKTIIRPKVRNSQGRFSK